MQHYNFEFLKAILSKLLQHKHFLLETVKNKINELIFFILIILMYIELKYLTISFFL